MTADPDQKKNWLMLEPSAGAGPLFVYVTVHVIGDPGDVLVAEGCADTARSALVSTAVLTLLEFEVGSLSVTPDAGSTREVAVTLEGDAVEKFPVIVRVTSPRCGSVGTVPVIAVLLTFSGAGHDAPAVAEQVAATLDAPAGMPTDRAVPPASVSELLPTVTVYVKAAPATAFVGPLMFVVTSTVVAATAGAGEVPAAIERVRPIDATMARSPRRRCCRASPLGRRQVLCLTCMSTFRVRFSGSNAVRGATRFDAAVSATSKDARSLES